MGAWAELVQRLCCFRLLCTMGLMSRGDVRDMGDHRRLLIHLLWDGCCFWRFHGLRMVGLLSFINATHLHISADKLITIYTDL